MKRTEKIDLIKSGKYIIENDMKWSKEADYVLLNISQVKLTTGWNFYGIFDLTNRFTFLSITQLNDRPRFKMSELVEVEKQKEVFTVEMYYVRNQGYLGNALIWWQKGRNGYTCDINNAHKFTKEEAELVCKRKEDTAYSCNYIDGLEIAKKLIIDCQYVDESNRLFI